MQVEFILQASHSSERARQDISFELSGHLHVCWDVFMKHGSSQIQELSGRICKSVVSYHDTFASL